jgi:hypothetical protein
MDISQLPSETAAHVVGTRLTARVDPLNQGGTIDQ